MVSHTSNEYFDAYVLSESSLFVYPSRLVIKTCGNTHLLNAASSILDFAAGLDMLPCRCKYSRASYLFPELQVPAMLPSGQKWTTSKEIASLGECMSDRLPCILIYATMCHCSPTFYWHIPFQDPYLAS